MKIIIVNQQKDLLLSKKHVRNIVQALLEREGISTDEVTFHFVTKKKISLLHKKFFQDPTPTDCITLPIDTPNSSSVGYSILGEVFVCPKVAIEYAQQNHLHPLDETLLYIVHGFLHLIGFDDCKLAEKKIMQKKEKECMDFLMSKKLGICQKQSSLWKII